MGEKIGLLFGFAIFFGIFVPFQVNMWLSNVEASNFQNAATEMQQLVNQEGGITAPVLEAKEKLADKGATIQFKDDAGNLISGKQPVGTTINIEYDYEYNNIYGKEQLATSNTTLVDRR